MGVQTAIPAGQSRAARFRRRARLQFELLILLSVGLFYLPVQRTVTGPFPHRFDGRQSEPASPALRQRIDSLALGNSRGILRPDLFALLPLWLRRNPLEFSERIQTAAPVRTVGPLYFGSGCTLNECGMEETAWAVDRTTGAAAAITMGVRVHPGTTGVHEGFVIYGSTFDTLPVPLAAWARQRGMTRKYTVEAP